jgi:hypothetical protein
MAVDSARPDVIVHELTAIGAIDMRHFDRDFALTNRLRTEGTDHLLSAGKSVGVGRFVAQGIAGYAAYERTGGLVKTEDDPLDEAPPREMRETQATIRHLEKAVGTECGDDGVVVLVILVLVLILGVVVSFVVAARRPPGPLRRAHRSRVPAARARPALKRAARASHPHRQRTRRARGHA